MYLLNKLENYLSVFNLLFNIGKERSDKDFLFSERDTLTNNVCTSSQEYINEVQDTICDDQEENCGPISYGVYYVVSVIIK